MASSCVYCAKSVKKRQHAIICDKCNRWTHRSCETGISLQDYRAAVKGDVEIAFVCGDCDDDTLPAVPHSPPTQESTRLSIAIDNSQYGEFRVETSIGSLVNTDTEPDATEADTTEADNTEAHSTEAHSTEAHSTEAQNNSSFEIENIPYQEPTIIQENSIEDESIGDVRSSTYQKTYTIIEGGSQKGKRKLADSDGYTYTVKRQRKDTVHWWCSVRNKSGRCPASVQQHGDQFSSGRHTHSHTARPGVATAVEITKQVKSESSINVFESASSIVERVVSTNTTRSDPEGSRPVLANLVRTANRVRERLRPKEPHDLSFEIAQNYIPHGFLRADVKVGDERHLIFATEEQLQLLGQAKQWFIDGTFKVVREPFHQILSIHSFIRSGEDCKMVPLVFCLMSRRRQKDYIKILQSITGMLQQQQLKCIVVDFEMAMWGAVKKVMPGVRIKGCVFHMTQAIWRKTQELGLQRAYNEDDTVHKFVKKLMALPFLPAEHVVPAFNKLKEKSLPGPITELLSYMENTWIYNNTYPVKSWCMYKQPIRTNNDVEGWHRRLNKKAGEEQKPFYVLIPLLHTEAKMVPLQAKLVSEKKLKRYQRQSSRYVQSNLFALWGNYKNGELTISQLLRQSSKLNGPTQEA